MHCRRSSKEPSGQADSISASHLISIFSGTAAPEWTARSAEGGVGRGSGGGNAVRDDSSEVEGLTSIDGAGSCLLGRFGMDCAKPIESFPSCGSRRITAPHTPPRTKKLKTPTRTRAAIRGSRNDRILCRYSNEDVRKEYGNLEKKSRVLANFAPGIRKDYGLRVVCSGRITAPCRYGGRPAVSCPEFRQYDSRSGYSLPPAGGSSPSRRAIRSASRP